MCLLNESIFILFYFFVLEVQLVWYLDDWLHSFWFGDSVQKDLSATYYAYSCIDDAPSATRGTTSTAKGRSSVLRADSSRTHRTPYYCISVLPLCGTYPISRVYTHYRHYTIFHYGHISHYFHTHTHPADSYWTDLFGDEPEVGSKAVILLKIPWTTASVYVCGGDGGMFLRMMGKWFVVSDMRGAVLMERWYINSSPRCWLNYLVSTRKRYTTRVSGKYREQRRVSIIEVPHGENSLGISCEERRGTWTEYP